MVKIVGNRGFSVGLEGIELDWIGLDFWQGDHLVVACN